MGLLLLAVQGPMDGQARVVAVNETEIPRFLAGLQPRHVLFDSLILAQLESAGITVIAPGVTAATWQRVRDSLGGYYDRFSGRVVAEKYQAVEAGTLAALRRDYRVTAWIRPLVAEVRAPFRGRTARWSGVEEGSGWGIGDGFLPALTLIIPVFDSAGSSVLAGTGGIQIVLKADGEAPPLLQDTSRIARAVRLAMGPVLLMLRQ
ncbi:MAG TPA: hypothetical protein VFD85_04485 [Gemmatimonadales bacterium]|nr:hypothetical protein [Gemmatimonadales bacterium]